MKTGETLIQPLPIGRPAIDVARECYAKWPGKVGFDEDLTEYLQYGIIVSRPDVFVMAKVVDFRGEPAWFIRSAVGDLKKLLQLVPVYLPWILFCRRNDPQLKAYPLKRILELVYKRGTKK